MDSFEAVMDAIKLKKPERVPVVPLVMTFAARLNNIPYSRYCQDSRALAESQLRCAKTFNYDLVTVCSDAYREASAIGEKIEFPYDGVPFCKERLIKSEADFKNLKLPDVRKCERTADRINGVRLLSNSVKNNLPVFGWIEAPFQETSILRGLTEMMRDLYSKPEFVKEVLEFVCDVEIEFGLAQIEAGADVIGAGDAVASMISKKHFNEYELPYIKKVFRKLKEAGAKTKYHICGNAGHLVELLGEIDADIINFDYYVDLKEAKRLIGNKVCIKGNIDPVAVLLQGNPDSIATACNKCIDDAGPDGFLLSPGCEVPTATSHENFKAMVKSAYDYKIQ